MPDWLIVLLNVLLLFAIIFSLGAIQNQVGVVAESVLAFIENMADVTTVAEVLTWAVDPITSSDRIQRTYDWQISRWSALGTAVLTSALGFVSTCVAEISTTPALSPSTSALLVVGSVLAFALYAYSASRIRMLRLEYRNLYTILMILGH